VLKIDTYAIFLSLTGQKMYSKQTVYDAHLKSKKHEKAAARLTATPSHSTANADASSSSAAPPPPSSLSALRHAKLRNPALLTYLTRALLISPLFTITLSDTRANVERRSALTARERELELSEPANELAPVADDGADPAAEGGEDDDDEKIYNPLKLPLGWDGKPIPYWLYKLHGLGVEYRCEICSDYAYMGRKNFERHFQVRFSFSLTLPFPPLLACSSLHQT
jgi:splicing factor 3A subunit 3